MALATDAGPEVHDPEEVARASPRWALAALLIGTAGLYLWHLNSSGWANSFYSAAAQAGSQSWKAFLFGSSDAANSITVDKPPMSLWLPALAVRIFGLNPWSLLVPEALFGVASVALLWDTVRRRFGEAAGLAAGLVLALTPVALIIFRYNNPDALLVLLTIAAMWAALRAVDDGRTRWLVLCGVFVGLAYLAKQLQVILAIPALSLPYLVAGPPALIKRLWQLVAALGAAIVAGGWWVLMVQLWPAADRPWIGGSRHNSVLELTFGYNGFGRITGQEPGSAGTRFIGLGGPNGGKFIQAWGQPGAGRLFQPAQVGQISWLLPAALIFLVALLVWRGRAARCDVQRASVLAWGLLLVCPGVVFSYMHGIFHPYYTVALAPAIAALTGIGMVVCFAHRAELWAQTALAAVSAATVATGYFVLGHSSHYYPWLRWVLVAAVAVVMVWVLRLGAAWTERRTAKTVVVMAIAVLALGGPAAYAATTLSRSISGALPSAGPPLHPPPSRAGQSRARGGCDLLDAGHPEPTVVARLEDDASAYTWVAATVGSSCASGYQLASGHPVMSIGGFNGSDPSPPLALFERLVLARRIHYYINAPEDARPFDKSVHLNNSGMIQRWVQINFMPIKIGDGIIYNLTQ